MADLRRPLNTLLLLLLPTLAHAQAPTLFTGQWSSALALDTQAEEPLEDVGILRNRLDFDLQHPLADDARTRLAARLHHVAAVGHEPDSRAPSFRKQFPMFGARYDAWADMREAYVQWDTRVGQLTIGRDIVQWGALEAQSPLRILNPVDFSQGLFGALGEETNAMADFLVRLVKPLGPGSLDLVYLPFFAQHRFSPFATDAAFVRQDLGPSVPQTLYPLLRRADLRLDRSLADTLMFGLDAPPATPLAGSLAGRWMVRKAGWDLGFAAIWNWDRLPKLHFDPDVQLVLTQIGDAGFDTAKLVSPALLDAMARLKASGKGPQDLVKADWQRRLTLGVQGNGEVAEGWTLRFDAAYAPRIDGAMGRVLFDTQFQPLVTSLLQAGAGVQHERGDWLVAFAEATWQWAIDVPAGRPLFLTDRHQVMAVGGVVLRLGEGQPWQVQAGGMYGVSLHDWAVVPRVQYELAPGWKAGLGAQLLGGPPASPAGLLRTDDQVVVDVRKAF